MVIATDLSSKRDLLLVILKIGWMIGSVSDLSFLIRCHDSVPGLSFGQVTLAFAINQYASRPNFAF